MGSTLRFFASFAAPAGLAVAAALGLGGCASLADALAGRAPVSVETFPLAAGRCSGAFIAADLPHEIEVDSPRVFNYDSLGAGLAAGDLDDDGDGDLVLANLDGPTALLWNETAPGGALQFRRTDLTSAEDSKPTSAVVTVDTDADGWLDLAVTHTNRPPTLWRNTPGEDGSGGTAGTGRRFVRDPDFGAGYFAHVMDWSDLDGDGDLDIVVSNLRAPSQVFENRLCGGGDHLLVDLRRPGTANTHTLGAGVVLTTTAGVELRREVRAQSGYLSGDTSRLHFGIPAGDAPAALQLTPAHQTHDHSLLDGLEMPRAGHLAAGPLGQVASRTAIRGRTRAGRPSTSGCLSSRCWRPGTRSGRCAGPCW